MKSRIAKMTVVAIVLLTGAPQIHAEEAAALPGGSPFAKAPGFASEASYSGYIGDDSELQEPPEIVDTAPPTAADWGPADAKYRSAHDLGKKGGKAGSGKAGHSGGAGVYSPWVSFEYMSTWLEGRYLPPLVSTSPPGTEGVVPGATVLFGGEDVSGNRQAAGKLSVGGWFDESERLGAGGKFFEVQTETIGFSAASNANGSPLLARPFYETWPSASGGVGPASFLVAGQTTVGTLPFTLTGDIQAVAQTDVMGAEGYLRYLLYCAPGRRVDLIGGYQFSRVDDRLQINNSTDYQPQIFGAHFEAEDLFDTQNKFHGGELGLLGEFGRGPVTLSVLAKLGMGNMNQVVTIDGRSALTDAGGFTSHYTSGILALPTNIGTYKQDKFALIPEAEIKLNFKLTRNLEATVGYDFIYWSTLALAGEQIDTSMGNLPTVNSSQWFGGALDPAGGAYPAFSGIKDSSLWLQGLSVGLTLRM
ncbi:MAG: BBP7 family outer membrane beta-barrel protein [Pirellulaceae bacterium]|nr:BBP7 family outer membrane beta-barrel protein [Pirellulaceae bacterium]